MIARIELRRLELTPDCLEVGPPSNFELEKETIGLKCFYFDLVSDYVHAHKVKWQ